MNELAVRIVKLEPLRVASFHGFGPSPEHLAAQKLAAWAGPRGYLADPRTASHLRLQQPEPFARQPELRLRVLDRSSAPEVEADGGGAHPGVPGRPVRGHALPGGRGASARPGAGSSQWLTDSATGTRSISGWRSTSTRRSPRRARS